MNILAINFQLRDMHPDEFEAITASVAPLFRSVPGLERKYWLADESTNTYGGLYVFESKQALLDYLASELIEGVTENPHFIHVSICQFGVLDVPTALTAPGYSRAA